MTQKFKIGDTVYSEDGQAAEYVARIAEGHIVRPMVEAYHGDEEYTHTCDPVTWRAAFSAPPVAKFNEELTAINRQIQAAREALNAVREEDRQFKASAKERAVERARCEQLRYVDDFLAGKLTHYAVFSEYYAPRVMLVGDATYGDRSYNKEMRLLCLYGKLDKMRTLDWQLHTYSDSSGSYGDTVVPARSQEEAEGYIRAHVAQRLESELKTPTYHATTAVDHADAWGVPVPETLRAISDAAKSKAAEQKIAEARKRHAAAIAELESLGIGAAA